MTSEPDPGTGLARRGETLPDIAASHRAGAIVSEFVSSIVEEAQGRAETALTAAEEEAAEQRQTALESSTRIRERVNALALDLAGLLEQLRRESDSLAAAIPGAAVQAPAQRALEESAVAERSPATVGDVAVAGSDLPDAPPDEAEKPEDDGLTSRVAAMTDEELARTYAGALRAAEGETDEAHASSVRDMVEATIAEALRRPAFAHAEPRHTPSLRRRARSRRRRRREAALADLREACERARQEQLALEPFGN